MGETVYYKEREPRKFDYKDEPYRGPGKRAIHMIILLLFLIAALILFFPGFFQNPRGAAGQNGAEKDAENEAPHSSLAAVSETAAGLGAGAR